MSGRAVRYVVRGKVQGVFYRASTVEKGRQLGLRGWVRNLPDGGVEIVAAGDGASLTELASWLWEGPPSARVDGVTTEEWTAGVAESTFAVR